MFVYPYLFPFAAHALTLAANLSEQSVSCALSATGETLANISVLASPPSAFWSK